MNTEKMNTQILNFLKKKFKILVLLFAIIGCINANAEKNVKIEFSACYAIMDLLENMQSGKSFNEVSQQLDKILNTESYQVMFKHYNRDWRPNHLPKDVFKRMILSLEYSDQYNIGENNRADQMIKKWRHYYADLSLFNKELDLMEKYKLNKMIPDAIKQAKSWLPNEMKIPDFNFYIFPHGGSNGFIIGNSTAYDLFQLDENIISFQSTIAHESHHMGLSIPSIKTNTEPEEIALAYLSMLVGEGTATKFLSNAPGGIVPAISDNSETSFYKTDIIKLWSEHTKSEEEIFLHFFDVFKKAFEGKLSEDDYKKDLRNYWLDGLTGRLYFIGSEIFGAIYYGFGKEGCFEAMRDPRKIFSLYNQAIEKKSELSACPRVPESLIEMALSIGKNKDLAQ